MIKLIPFEDVTDDVLRLMIPPITDTFHQTVDINSRLGLGRDSWNPKRGQHKSDTILDTMPLPQPGDRYLGVMDADIFAFGLNFVFGEADADSKKAVISLVRLKQEFYGLPPDGNLFKERILTEAVHELGHTYSLNHCLNTRCVMHFSISIEDTDLKGWKFCPVCQKRLNSQMK